MKPSKEQIEQIMDNLKEIGGISLDIIYSEEKTNLKAKQINKKAYECWNKLAKILTHHH